MWVGSMWEFFSLRHSLDAIGVTESCRQSRKLLLVTLWYIHVGSETFVRKLFYMVNFLQRFSLRYAYKSLHSLVYIRLCCKWRIFMSVESTFIWYVTEELYKRLEIDNLLLKILIPKGCQRDTFLIGNK